MAGMFKVIGPTSLRSIAAHLVNVRDQSKLFSFISASDGILQLVTSAVYNYLLWQMTEQHAPSASFFVSLALALIAVFITLAIRSILIWQRQSDTDDVAHIIDDSD
ncbi:hypothetical protein EB796_005216 [Bugula neritina]|uniref:Uncharacterized protein n=1 Tax=Bugula neritina TaxID=10212 RepID=A0A7J7KG62_BUGNE|nr:hypothetical protein EB796_005216 [Bugula neritina]